MLLCTCILNSPGTCILGTNPLAMVVDGHLMRWWFGWTRLLLCRSAKLSFRINKSHLMWCITLGFGIFDYTEIHSTVSSSTYSQRIAEIKKQVKLLHKWEGRQMWKYIQRHAGVCTFSHSQLNKNLVNWHWCGSTGEKGCQFDRRVAFSSPSTPQNGWYVKSP